MDIFQALQMAWLLEQLTVLVGQIWEILPAEISSTLAANQMLAGIVTAIIALVGLKILLSVFD